MKKHKWVYNGVEYDSIADAARANGREPRSMYTRYYSGYTSDNENFVLDRRVNRRQAILDFIQTYHRANHAAPTFAEIALAVYGNDNPGLVNYHLKALRAGGFVTWVAGSPRTIRVLKATYKEKES